jgi:hypothetical protein
MKTLRRHASVLNFIMGKLMFICGAITSVVDVQFVEHSK